MASTRKADRLLGAPERRSFECEEFELRATGDTTLTLSGYASVFDKGYEMYGGPDKGGWTEIVDRRAFDETLKRNPDLHLLINHEGMPLARTKSGTLQLSADSVGLRVNAELNRMDPDVQRLEVKMARGDMNEMSFAFRTVRQAWNDAETERRLLELNLDKGDVSVVNFGANPNTTAGLRSAQDFLAAIVSGEEELDPVELRSAHEAIGRLLKKPAEARDSIVVVVNDDDDHECMTCPDCGCTDVPADASFCPDCGAAMTATCADCGCTDVSADANYCPDCGSQMPSMTAGARALSGMSVAQARRLITLTA